MFQAGASRAARKCREQANPREQEAAALDRVGIRGPHQFQRLRGNELGKQRHTERRKQGGDEHPPQQRQQRSSMMVVLVRRWATGPDPFDLEGHIKGAGLIEGESA